MQRHLNHLNLSNLTPQQLRRWRWLLPLSLMLFVFFFEIGPSRWIYERLGYGPHMVADILLFGTIGPILVSLLLAFVSRWLEERQTSDLQVRLLTQTQQAASRSRQLNDDAVQILFAASALIDTLEASHDLPQETAVQVQTMQRTLQSTIEQLRQHLLNGA